MTAIRPCSENELETIYAIINAAAQVYKGIIPADRWHDPYMTREALQQEIEARVIFWGYEQEGEILGVMGIQDVQDVTLIRHAYVWPANQGQGIGGRLLARLRQLSSRPILIGTWADAYWAIRFYEKYGFRPVSEKQKNWLLDKYWSIPKRQIETSIVLAEETWFATLIYS